MAYDDKRQLFKEMALSIEDKMKLLSLFPAKKAKRQQDGIKLCFLFLYLTHFSFSSLSSIPSQLLYSLLSLSILSFPTFFYLFLFYITVYCLFF